MIAPRLRKAAAPTVTLLLLVATLPAHAQHAVEHDSATCSDVPMPEMLSPATGQPLAPKAEPKASPAERGTPPRTAELLIVLDDTFIAAHGDDAATVSAGIFNIAKSRYDATLSDQITLDLAGQLSYAHGLPDDVVVHTCDMPNPVWANLRPLSDPCCSTSSPVFATCPDQGDDIYCLQDPADATTVTQAGCYQNIGANLIWSTSPPTFVRFINLASSTPISTSADDLDFTTLLDTFNRWVRINRSSLESLLGRAFDAAALVTRRDFVGSTIGLATRGGMCSEVAPSVVVQDVDDPELCGTKLAHEVGHLLNMGHDGVDNGCAATGFVMEVTFVPPVPLTFSSCSRSEMIAWLGTGAGACLDNTPSGPAWTTPRCGDGRLDSGEDCDAGYGEFAGSCCASATCAFDTGCACANYDACCSGGTVLGAGTPCRPSADSTCDFAETCDGVSGACPRDLYASPGTACVSADGYDGDCLDGACVSGDQTCFDAFGTEQCSFLSVTCGDPIWCVTPGNPSTCSNSTAYLTPTGLECATGQQCLADACVSSTALKDYAWYAGPWGTCVGGMQSRVVVCQDETGATAADLFCTAAKPATTQACVPAPSYAWETGPWSTCASGTQSRAVTCVDQNTSATVPESNCTETKPATVRACTERSLLDFAAFQRCWGSGSVPPECAAFNYDGDSDVDVADLENFLTELVGPL
ncbi:MAG TPA: M12 family metallo-peptidase [Phycisphaerae bacterium]|nr:M12 family metallo-peptidase [Phycisphaerae bacterium]